MSRTAPRRHLADTYLNRLDTHLAGGYLSEEDAHKRWTDLHERYKESFGLNP